MTRSEQDSRRWLGALLIALLACVVAATAPAATQEESAPAAQKLEALPDVGAVSTLAERFAGLVAQGEIEGAFATLKPHWSVADSEVDALASQLISQRSGLETKLGKPLGLELAGVQTIGTLFRRYLYFDKYERHAIAWIVSFYRPAEGWVVSTVRLSDQLDSLYRWE